MRTPDPHHFPCPPGSYNPKTGSNSSKNCLPCDRRKYCAGYGNEKPSNSCAPGWYCPGGSDTPNGYPCEEGYFCPEGSYNMTPCTQGKYCDRPRLAQPVDDCDPGYYCPLNSRSRTQKQCPPGHYCPKGSPIPKACKPGTYVPGYGHANESECLLCEAGKFCNVSGLSEPQGECDPGYFCPPGQSTSNPSAYPCPAGHFCKHGSPKASRCPNGTYQVAQYQSDCDLCPRGYYCDSTELPVTSRGLVCPAGHYCLPGTKFATQYKCPGGTWSNRTNLVDSSDCFGCPPR